MEIKLAKGTLRVAGNIDVVVLLRSAPRTEKLTINLARALDNMNRLDEARDALTEALSAHPSSLPLSSALIVVLVKQGRYEEAIKLAQHIADVNPANSDAVVQLFRILVLTNHINAARPIGPKLLAARPHDPEVLYLNGIVLRAVGDYPGAKNLLEKSVATDPNSPNSHYELGMVLVFLKEWAPARQELEKASALPGGTEDPTVWEHLGDVYGAMGQRDRAGEAYRRAIALEADDPAKAEAVRRKLDGLAGGSRP